MFFEHVMINNYCIPKVYENNESIRKLLLHWFIDDNHHMIALLDNKGYVLIRSVLKARFYTTSNNIKQSSINLPLHWFLFISWF